MLPWKFEIPVEINVKENFDDMLKNGIRDDHIEFIHSLLLNMQAKALLKDLFRSVVHCHLQNPCETSKNSLLEMVAAFDYALVNKVSGKLDLIHKICLKNRAASPALAYMRSWCERARENELWKQPDFWFDSRVMCMDVYTLAHIFSCKRGTLCIFYGGESHAQCANRVLKKYKAARTETPTVLKACCQGKKLMSVNTYFLKERLITVIGERHDMTDTSFGAEFILLLKKWCKHGQKITVLIEKHIAVTHDNVQTKLMCNMPTMAIHRFRCDSFVESNECSNINIIPVDNRHYDLGFLRTEIFHIWNMSPEFRRAALIFHKKALSALFQICYTLEQSISSMR